jgi:hypothetical protein
MVPMELGLRMTKRIPIVTIKPHERGRGITREYSVHPFI